MAARLFRQLLNGTTVLRTRRTMRTVSKVYGHCAWVHWKTDQGVALQSAHQRLETLLPSLRWR